MTKIYIVSWHGKNTKGGMERVTYYLEQILKDNNEVEIVDKERLKQIKWIGLLADKHYILNAILMSLYIGLEFGRIKDKIIITQGYNAPFVKADLTFAHGTMKGYKMAKGIPFSKWKWNELFEMYAMKRARGGVIAVSERVKQEVAQYYSVAPERIRVLPNCVDSALIYPLPRDDENRIVVLYCGRLEHMKGLERILSLAKSIECEKGITFRIAALGLQNTEKFNFKNTKIIVDVKKEELNHFYNSGNVLYFPSLYEGFEMVSLEALSAGLPIVGNPVGALAELREKFPEAVVCREKGASVESDLLQLRKMAEKYRDIQRREELHNKVRILYDIETYKKKLMELIEKGCNGGIE